MYNDELKIRKKTKKKANKKKPFFTIPFNSNSEQLLPKLNKLFNKIMWNEIVFSIGCIILGIIFYLFSEISTVTIGIILGIYFLAMGIVKIYAYFNRKQIPLFHYNLFYGIISIILGIITIFEPFTFTKVVTTMIGIWLIYVAIVKIDLSIRLKMIGEKSWLFLLISALLVIFMGIVLIVNPFNNLLLTQIIGSFLILFGVVHSTDAFLIKKRASKFLENLDK